MTKGNSFTIEQYYYSLVSTGVVYCYHSKYRLNSEMISFFI